MLSQLNLRFPKKLIDSLKNRASAEKTSVNALTERLLDSGLRSPVTQDDYLTLLASPLETHVALYKKIIRGETFGHHSLKLTELRYLFDKAHEACDARTGLMSWPVIEDLLNITFEALIYATESGIEVDRYYIDRAFGFAGVDYRAETQAFMATLRHDVDTGYAEFLLRPLSSGALLLEAFADEALAEICTPARLKRIFPLLMRAREQEHLEEAYLEALRPMVESADARVNVNDICLQLSLRGNQNTVFPGGRYLAPHLTLLLSADRFIIPLGWAMFSELVRLCRVRVWLEVDRDWSHQGQRVGIYLPRGEKDEVILAFDGLRVFMTGDEYARVEAGLLAALEEPAMSAAVAHLQALYGDL